VADEPVDGAPPKLFDTDRSRLAELRRAVQAQIAVDASAFSADGRLFHYQAPIEDGLTVGTLVTLTAPDGRRFLGQIVSQEPAVRMGPALKIDLGTDLGQYLGGARLSEADIQMEVRHAAGQGLVLARTTDDGGLAQPSAEDTFNDAAVVRAEGALVGQYLRERSGKRATLDVGVVTGCEDPPRALVRADGFDRHTFLCGQSGSGKTYSLGLLVERLLTETDLRLVIIDPNSDFVRLGEPLTAEALGRAPEGMAERYAKAAAGVRVLRPASVAPDGALRVAFSELPPDEQAMVLQLDPLDAREEYHAFSQMAGSLEGGRYSLAEVRQAAGGQLSEQARQINLRISNLGSAAWEIWAERDQETIEETLGGDWRALILDIGGFGSAQEKSVVANAALGYFWRHRDERRPVLIVIDEAHTVCPGDATESLVSRAAEYCVRIAGEGRKYGLYMLIATQRPQKIHPSVLTQCDNLVLMRMNSSADLSEVSRVFSFVPSHFLDAATRFTLGEALLAGKITPTPLVVRLQGRLTAEGGGDIPADWAERR
jgi:hypothetical protein